MMVMTMVMMIVVKMIMIMVVVMLMTMVMLTMITMIAMITMMMMMIIIMMMAMMMAMMMMVMMMMMTMVMLMVMLMMMMMVMMIIIIIILLIVLYCITSMLAHWSAIAAQLWVSSGLPSNHEGLGLWWPYNPIQLGCQQWMGPSRNEDNLYILKTYVCQVWGLCTWYLNCWHWFCQDTTFWTEHALVHPPLPIWRVGDME